MEPLYNKESVTAKPSLTSVNEDMEDTSNATLSSSPSGGIFSLIHSMSGLGKKKKDPTNGTVAPDPTGTASPSPKIASMPSVNKRSFMVRLSLLSNLI